MIASDDMSSAVLFAALRGRPTVAVLDTSCVRTGLGQQVNNGRKPASLTTAQDGTIRLFMEKATLEETLEKLPLFADQLKVPLNDLRRMFATDWKHRGSMRRSFAIERFVWCWMRRPAVRRSAVRV